MTRVAGEQDRTGRRPREIGHAARRVAGDVDGPDGAISEHVDDARERAVPRGPATVVSAELPLLEVALAGERGVGRAPDEGVERSGLARLAGPRVDAGTFRHVAHPRDVIEVDVREEDALQRHLLRLEPRARVGAHLDLVDAHHARREAAERGVLGVVAERAAFAAGCFRLTSPDRSTSQSAPMTVSTVTGPGFSTIEYLDLSRRAADLALRFASPVQRDVVTLATLDLEVAAFASPAYARSLPRGYEVRDVAWIAWAPPLDHLSPNPELARLIRDFEPVFASDDFLVQQRAAQAGLGAIFLGRVEHRFATGGELVELDLDLGHISRSLYVAGARGALDIPRVRAVADLLVTELGRTVAKKRTKER